MIRHDLAFQPPLAWDALLAFIGARAAREVEYSGDRAYARTVHLGGCAGTIRVAPSTAPSGPSGALEASSVLSLEASDALAPVLPAVISRVRHLLDLDANTRDIESHLMKAEMRLVGDDRCGLRVPGAFDGFELAVRAVLGQQVTVKGASTLMSRLVIAFGEEIHTGRAELTHISPSAERMAAANVSEIRSIGLPNARAATLLALATAVASGDLTISPDADAPDLIRRLRTLPGIGPWTAEYIAMRAAHWSDAFPVGDLALRRAAGDVSAAELQRIAEQWRPWRAYAAMHLWATL